MKIQEPFSSCYQLGLVFLKNPFVISDHLKTVAAAVE